MPRVPRTSLSDGYFHVFSRGVASARNVFRDEDDRDVFVDFVWRVAATHRWKCHAICVLASHYHLVLETGRDDMSSGLQRLN